jgi:hypothetical protein
MYDHIQRCYLNMKILTPHCVCFIFVSPSFIFIRIHTYLKNTNRKRRTLYLTSIFWCPTTNIISHHIIYVYKTNQICVNPRGWFDSEDLKPVVCSSQCLRFESFQCHFLCLVSPLRVKLWLQLGLLLVDDRIDIPQISRSLNQILSLQMKKH